MTGLLVDWSPTVTLQWNTLGHWVLHLTKTRFWQVHQKNLVAKSKTEGTSKLASACLYRFQASKQNKASQICQLWDDCPTPIKIAPYLNSFGYVCQHGPSMVPSQMLQAALFINPHEVYDLQKASCDVGENIKFIWAYSFLKCFSLGGGEFFFPGSQQVLGSIAGG